MNVGRPIRRRTLAALICLLLIGGLPAAAQEEESVLQPEVAGEVQVPAFFTEEGDEGAGGGEDRGRS